MYGDMDVKWNTVVHITYSITKFAYRPQRVNAASCSGGPVLDFNQDAGYQDLGVSWFFQPCSQMPGRYPKLRQDHFQPHTLQLVIHWSSYHLTVLLSNDLSVMK
jgi:hypothetical protein